MDINSNQGYLDILVHTANTEFTRTVLILFVISPIAANRSNSEKVSKIGLESLTEYRPDVLKSVPWRKKILTVGIPEAILPIIRGKKW